MITVTLSISAYILHPLERFLLIGLFRSVGPQSYDLEIAQSVDWVWSGTLNKEKPEYSIHASVRAGVRPAQFPRVADNNLQPLQYVP